MWSHRIAAGAVALLLLGSGLVLSGTTTGSVTPANGPTTPATSQTIASFPRDQVIEVNVNMAEADLNEMLANGVQEQEYPAAVTWSGKTLPNISIRTKGNSSLRSVARSDSKRFSFKLDLNQFVDGQNLDGISTINLNNNFSDPTYMREYLSYEALDSLGLPTPARTWVRLSLNDELWGLYLAVEQIGAPFLERSFGSSSGDLYKPANQYGQGADLKWYGEDYASYPGIVYKGKGRTDHQALLDMLDTLNNGGDLEQVLDIDAVLKYVAACTAMVSLDSYQGQFAHNYYLYEQDGKFTVIPWDFNMSFGGMGGSGSAVKIDSPTSVALVERPLIAKLLEVPEYKERYHGYIEELTEGYLEPERFEARAREVMAILDPYVKEDPTKFVTYEQFQNSLEQPVSDTGTTTADGGISPAVSAPPRAMPGQRGQRGLGGPGGGETVALLTFLRAQVANLQQQLNGSIPTTDTTVTTPGAPGVGIPGGRPMGGAPAGGFPAGRRMPPNGAGGLPDGQVPDAEEQDPSRPPSGDYMPIAIATALILGGTIVVWKMRPGARRMTGDP